jgi:hypothetical protein
MAFMGLFSNLSSKIAEVTAVKRKRMEGQKMKRIGANERV